MIRSTINYNTIIEEFSYLSYNNMIKSLSHGLPDIWLNKYIKMTRNSTNVIKFSESGFQFLFDFSSELVLESEKTKETHEDRVVAVYGKSKLIRDKRDRSRMVGFLGPSAKVFNKNYDKGHFIGHSLGGGLDVNLFPQLKEINRGLSQRGKVFRKMERHCSKNIGTFCFSRPIYQDDSWIPSYIEYGILLKDGSLWVELFEN